jgi:hypothetical protein
VSFEPVSRTRHRHLGWHVPSTPAHCRQRALLALTRRDLRRVCRISPIAFAETPQGWAPVLLNLPAANRIADFDARWLQMALPDRTALHPFAAIWQHRDGKWIMGVTTDPGLVNASGERFFDDTGSLTPTVTEAARRLARIEAERPVLLAAANRLALAGLLEDLPQIGPVRQRIAVMRHDGRAALAQMPDPLVVELGYAAAFSLRMLAEPLARQLTGAGDLVHLLPPPQAAAPDPRFPSALKAPDGIADLSDDDTITFGFGGRRGLFASG